MKQGLKSEKGSAMILALLFLLFCSLLGSSLMAAAWANGARAAEEGREEADFLACRSGLMLLRREFQQKGQPQLTIRDVTVKENKVSTRTVTYILQNCGDSLLAEYLVGYAVNRYEEDTGAPDARIYENFSGSWTPEADAAEGISLQVSENRELTGLCTVSKDLDLRIRLKSGEGELVLRFDAVKGKADTVKLNAEGIRTTTKTTVIRWEEGIIEKGGTQ